MFKRTVFAGILSAAGVLFGAALVENGTPCASIVLGKQPSTAAQTGAYELQYHIEKMTGAKLPITNEASGTGTHIFIGETEFANSQNLKNADFKNQEYLVRVKGNDIILMGRDADDFRPVDYQNFRGVPDKWSEIGTLYAVYDFLQLLGFQWYMPGDLGITFTPSKNLSVNEHDVRRVPSLSYRDYGNAVFPADLVGDTMAHPDRATFPTREARLYELRKRVGGKRVIISHSFNNWPQRFPDKQSWFAQGYGEVKTAQLCYTNPEVIQQVVQDARDFFDGKKSSEELFSFGRLRFQSDIYPVVPGDDRSWCQCPQCQSQIMKKAKRGSGFSDNRATDYILGFVNAVAKEVKKTHPDKYIGALSYASYFFPPENVPLEDNLIILICVENIDKNDTIFEEWKEKFPKIKLGAWQYYCFPTLTARAQQVRLFPGLTARNVEKNFRKYENENFFGMFWEPPILYYSHRSAAMEMLEGHILWELAFNRNLSGEKMFDDFFPAFFGLAANPMKEFYTTIEDLYCGYVRSTGKRPNETASWTELGNEKLLNKLEALIAEAKKLAPDTPFNERIELFDKAILQYMKKGHETCAKADLLRSQSMQQAIVVKVACPEPGNPEKIDWDRATNLFLYGGMKAEPLTKKIALKVAHDGAWFYMMLHEKCDPSTLKKDGNIFWTDAWEAFFAKQRALPYNHTVSSISGGDIVLQHTDVTIDSLKPEQNVSRKIDSNAWTVYAAIPLEALVPDGIQPGEMLYFNIIRTSQGKALACWIPTFAGYLTPERFGQLWLEK